ncbi:MAG: aminotransferase class III-fold pyridoxal phosphate-dependent enzyme [bacterium]|nr:aminotransferase class III-fold pyridoxal phosphate-dependent enzyme [bacterium]
MKWWEELSKMSQDEILAMSREYSARSTQFDNGFVQWRGKGPLLEGWDHRRAYDLSSGVGSKNIGQHDDRIAAVKRWFAVNEISNIPDHDFPHPIAALLKRELCRVTPGAFPKKVFMGRGGAEANEHAIKLALEAKPEGTDFAFSGSFHGRSFGALRFTSSKSVQWKGFVPKNERPKFLPFPEAGHDCRSYLADMFNRILSAISSKGLRMFFAEAVQGEGGINVACADCFQVLLLSFQDVGGILVMDEVQTGFMRTGKMFACEWYGIVPDVISLGKSLCPSHSLAASVFRADLDMKPGRNSNTGVDAEACAMALENIEILEGLDRSAIEQNIETLSRVAPVGLGLMRRIECESKAQRDAIVDAAAKLEPVALILLGAGSEARGERYIRLMPAVTTTPEELTEMLALLRQVTKTHGLVLLE